MNIELLPGLDNVIRFPIEERAVPSMALIWRIQPDCREVGNVADAFHLDTYDHGMKDAADAETARYIAEQFLPADPALIGAQLDGLLEDAVVKAVAACRETHRITVRAVAAQQKAYDAKVGGGDQFGALDRDATRVTCEAAAALVNAHNLCRAAHGVNRAVTMARQGEPWAPYDPRADDEVFSQGAKRVQTEAAPVHL